MYDFKAIVKCPKCGYQQSTTTVDRVRCFECGHVYTIFPHTKHGKPKKSRIVKVLKGDSWKKYYEYKKWKDDKKRAKAVPTSNYRVTGQMSCD